MALPVQAQAELLITIIGGPDKGAAYKVLSSKVTLGRAAENDIVLKDPRCSRKHAIIQLTNEGIVVEDLGSQHGIEINGTQTRRAVLNPGDPFKVGNTTLVLKLQAMSQAPRSAGQLPAPPMPQMPQQMVHGNVGGQGSTGQVGQQGQSQYGGGRQAAKNNKMRFYIIVGGVALVAFLLLSEQQKSKDPTPVRTDTMVEEDIKQIKEKKKAILDDQKLRGVGTPERSEVQGLYLQGYRDYREGNFVRALDSFNAVLALDPKHELAFKYREFSRRRLDELLSMTMQEGKRFLEQGKFAAAQRSFEQVKDLVLDKTSARFKEAAEYADECRVLIEGAY